MNDLQNVLDAIEKAAREVTGDLLYDDGRMIRRTDARIALSRSVLEALVAVARQAMRFVPADRVVQWERRELDIKAALDRLAEVKV